MMILLSQWTHRRVHCCAFYGAWVNVCVCIYVAVVTNTTTDWLCMVSVHPTCFSSHLFSHWTLPALPIITAVLPRLKLHYARHRWEKLYSESANPDCTPTSVWSASTGENMPFSLFTTFPKKSHFLVYCFFSPSKKNFFYTVELWMMTPHVRITSPTWLLVSHLALQWSVMAAEETGQQETHASTLCIWTSLQAAVVSVSLCR